MVRRTRGEVYRRSDTGFQPVCVRPSTSSAPGTGWKAHVTTAMNIHYYVSCFVVRPAGGSHEFLQLRRRPGKYMGDTWQLVTGGIDDGETAWRAALRELREETSLVPIEFYQVDVVNTFYLAETDRISHSPMFCAIVAADGVVKLDDEHTAHRWVPRDQIMSVVMWPGERAALGEVFREILDGGPSKPYLRIELDRKS
jgi:dihydroneopterin triphosphate diphosphatase